MISYSLLIVFFFLLFFLSFFSEAKSIGFREGSVFVSSYGGKRKFDFSPLRKTGAAATGTFEDMIDKNGWGILKVETQPGFQDLDQYHAAGYLECLLTAEHIYSAYLNMYDYFFGNGKPSSQLIDWLNEQDQWVREQISANYTDLSSYWKQVSLLVEQFDGCREGYEMSGMPDIGLFGIQLVNDMGDLLDLEAAVDTRKRVDWHSLSPKDFHYKVMNSGHCSAIVKVTGDLGELFSSHSSWFTYGAMLRIYKHYHFQTNETFASSKTSYSSYPGLLSSLDDFYMMDSGLVVLQTTNNIWDTSLYDLVLPSSLLAWQRVRLANAMANNGKEWGELVSQYNSGTYNNQYMVVDYKLWVPNQPLQPGLLWVVEQIPGLVVYEDQTELLEFGYWPSYNVPFYTQIYEISGYPEIVEKYGTDYSYDLAPRAKIFRRDQTNVTDIESLKYIMRYNDYLHDPYANGDPWAAICSRGDLDPSSPSAGGCYDTKVTYSKWISELKSEAINGPTTSNNIPVWEWTSQWNNTAHYGQPDLYDFSFVSMYPDWNSF